MTNSKEYDRLYRLRHLERYKENRKMSNSRLREKRASLIAEIKLSRGCADCGYNLAPEALHFDHRDPREKKFTIGTDMYRSLESVLLEIAKCDVRCANCHAIRSKRLGHHKGKKA